MRSRSPPLDQHPDRVYVAKSDKIHLASGVPQGTVICPLRFLLYINDLGRGVNSSLNLFADDYILLRQINTETDSITPQEDLDTVVQWSEKWQLSFNPQKWSVLTVTNKKIIFHYYKMCGVELVHVNRQAYLGLEFASHLSWGPYTQKITSKTSKDLNMIRRNISNAPQVVKELAYKSFIRPSVEYAHISWDLYQHNHIKQVERIQRKVVRYVPSNYERQDSLTEMRERLCCQTHHVLQYRK